MADSSSAQRRQSNFSLRRQSNTMSVALMGLAPSLAGPGNLQASFNLWFCVLFCCSLPRQRQTTQCPWKFWQSSLLPTLSSMPSWNTPALMFLVMSGIEDDEKLGVACLPRECHGCCLVLVLVRVAWASSQYSRYLGGSVCLEKDWHRQEHDWTHSRSVYPMQAQAQINGPPA